jgi:hypothetical protein
VSGSGVEVVARIPAVAEEVLGSRDDARAGLRERNGVLGGEVPPALLDTKRGRPGEAVPGRIAYGIVE